MYIVYVADQTTLILPLGSSVFSSSAVSNYSYPVPTTTAGKTVSLAFSGFEINYFYNNINFDTTWMATGSQVYINLQVLSDITFGLIKYNILIVDESLKMAQLINRSNCKGT